MQVLITGGTGLVGRHLVERLVAAGETITCLVRKRSDTRHLEGLGVRCTVGDMVDAASLAGPVAAADVVVHAAAMLRAPWRPTFATHNVGGTAGLAAACAAAPEPPVLIVVSSLAAAGPSPEGRPRSEVDGAAPVSLYGRVKRAAEEAAEAVADRVPVTIVRPPMVFGAADRNTLPLFKMAANGWHVVPRWQDAALSLVHAAELAQLLWLAATKGKRVRPCGNDATGVYYAAAEVDTSLAGLGERLALALDRPPPRTVRLPMAVTWIAATAGSTVGRLRDRPTAMTLDKARELAAGAWCCSAAKASEELGYRPEARLNERLRETAAWYRQERWL